MLSGMGFIEDDRSDRLVAPLPAQGGRQLVRFQAVDDVNLTYMARAQHQLQDGALDDEIVQIPLQQFLHADRSYQLGIFWIFLRIGRVKSIFILDINHPPSAENLGNEEAAGVGALGWNSSNLRI